MRRGFFFLRCTLCRNSHSRLLYCSWAADENGSSPFHSRPYYIRGCDRMAYNSTTDSTFVALIDRDGNIRDMSASQRGTVIGMDWQREEEYKRTIAEMQETLDNYYNRLVSLGEITIPKSPEEIAREAAAEQLRITQEQLQQQADLNQMMFAALEKMNAKIEGMESNGSNRDADGSSGKQSGNNSESGGTPRKPSKSSA